jgi:endonuclease/exonuclease/phosphatase family metal-dependent hydrolase
VVNVHLGLSGVERRWQIRRLLSSAPFARLRHASRVVIAGDMNDWAGALSRRRGALRKAGFVSAWGHHHGSARTFPAWYPVVALDRVFLRGPIVCRHACRSRHLLARRASDHLPVVVDLKMGDK